MGNNLSNGDGFAAWELMTEDTMLVVLKHLTVYDYVQLSLACRRFLYFLLGPNDYFWAQLCNNLLSEEDQQPSNNGGDVMSQFYWNLPLPAELRYRPKTANDLLKYVQKGRKFIVDGRQADLNRKINTIDKHFVSHFNFKEEIKAYFFDAILRVNLEMELRKLVQRSILQRITVDVERQPDLKNLWTKLDNISHHYNLDYSFVVDIGTDPMAFEWQGAADLPFVYKNRLVWYLRDGKHQNPLTISNDIIFYQEMVLDNSYNKIPNLYRHPDVFQLPTPTTQNEQPIPTKLQSLVVGANPQHQK